MGVKHRLFCPMICKRKMQDFARPALALTRGARVGLSDCIFCTTQWHRLFVSSLMSSLFYLRLEVRITTLLKCLLFGILLLLSNLLLSNLLLLFIIIIYYYYYFYYYI